ncbi:MAG: methyltransferase [Gemmatimonadetes bacterium]|nr:methyltransferase [Gemmatimonadota bacterium]
MTTYAQYWAVARRIPRGRVATYGQVAELAGLRGRARQAGYAMSALPDESDVPWHRVVNARGEVRRRSGGPAFEKIQRALLEAEGGVFDAAGRISLERYGWRPGGAASRRRNASSTARK